MERIRRIAIFAGVIVWVGGFLFASLRVVSWQAALVTGLVFTIPVLITTLLKDNG